MSEFLKTDKTINIRQPSTANLMIDSADGPQVGGYRKNPWDFLINPTASILNGYFTRVATTEVVLEWNIPNISEANNNNSLTFTVESGGTHTIILLDGFYTTVQLLTTFINEANNSQVEVVFKLDASGFFVASATGSPNVSFTATNLLAQLGIVPNDPADTWYLSNVDLRYYRYLDFVSSKLTANQDVKDSTTNPYKRDVLCRWYMAYDNPVPVDSGGWPVLMGYEPFQLRRIFSPPKQIRWESNISIGQLDFQVYGTGYSVPNGGEIIISPVYDSRSNWLMSLQITEV